MDSNGSALSLGNETCNKMATFGSSPALIFSLIVNWVFTAIAFPISCFSLYYLKKQQLFHHNTRFQIYIHLVALVVHCIGRLVLHSLDLKNYLGGWSSGCEILPNFYRCLIFRFLYNTGQIIVSVTPISIVLERCLAIRYGNNYENCSLRIGFVLGFLQLFLAFCYLFTRYISSPWSPDEFTYFYCQTVTSSSKMTRAQILLPIHSIFILQVISKISFELLERKNKKLRAVVDISLSTRYTIAKSLRSILALKAFINANCLAISIVTFSMSVSHFQMSKDNGPNYMAIVEFTHAIPLYGIIACIGVYTNLRNADDHLRTLYRSSNKTSDIYFEMFNKQIKKENA